MYQGETPMRLARKLILLVAAVVTVQAFGASAASATETVQVVDEGTAQACGALTGGGGCRLHAVGAATLQVDLGFFEATEATCNLEAAVRVNSSGNGVIDGLEHNTGPDANCASVITECKTPWSFSGEEDGTTAVVQASAAVCVNSPESDSNCEGNLAFNVVEQDVEHYEVQLDNAPFDGCELDVDLEVEAPSAEWDAIHVNHP